MAFDIFSTHTLLMAIEQLTPPSTFLRDRYFPTNGATDVFSTNDVLVEYKDGNKKMAPFVSPRKGGVTIVREGYYMQRYTPPKIAPQRSLTIDDLKKRGFGEALFSKLTPQQRESAMLLKDADEMGAMIARREEYMAAQTMLNNGCIMRHYSDDLSKYEEKEIRFYSEGSNPAVYTPAKNWDEAGADIIGDIYAMIQFLTERGLPVEELLVASDVAQTIILNAGIQKLLDIKNYNMGRVEPKKLPSGASVIATINVYGHMIDIISYNAKYEADDGSTQQYIPAGKVVLTAPSAGRTLYGAVTQLEQHDGRFHTYTGKRVPKYLASAENNTRSLTLTSHPLLIPNQKNPWFVAQVQ